MSFELQPVLKGSLVELRPLREEDFEALYTVASDPLIWEQHPSKNRCEREVFGRFFRGAMDSGGAFLVLDSANGKVIGSTRFCNYEPDQSEIEIGFTFLARSYWGGAYNGEMKRLMLDHAFKFVNRVVFSIWHENWRSRRAVEKIGATFLSDGVDDNGVKGVDYELTAEAYTARHLLTD
jgi:RimJ/RimL family protein N-acetyltransferase